MKPYRYIITVFSIVMVLFLINSFVFASEAESLKGIEGMEVIIEHLETEIEEAGLTEEKIRTDVELKLRMAGIKVITREEKQQIAGSPTLIVTINIIKINTGGYVYNIDLDFYQAAYLEINNYKSFVSTWSNGWLVFTSNLNNIRDNLKDKIDIFLNDYLSVNPKP